MTGHTKHFLGDSTRLLRHPRLEESRSLREEKLGKVSLTFFATFPLKLFANSYAAQAALNHAAIPLLPVYS